jgi:urease accessory protein
MVNFQLLVSSGTSIVRSMKRLLIASLLVAPVLAHANTGAGPAHGFFHGVQHPVFGLDHLLAMIAVGLWAVQAGGRAIWAVPASFVGVMTLGGLLGMAGFQLPMVETGILVSVLLLGLLVAFAVKLPVWAGASLVGVFALFHGYAHGAEMPAEASGVAYAAGFALATAVLHSVGIGFGLAVRNVRFAPILRMAGAAVMLAGVALALS